MTKRVWLVVRVVGVIGGVTMIAGLILQISGVEAGPALIGIAGLLILIAVVANFYLRYRSSRSER